MTLSSDYDDDLAAIEFSPALEFKFVDSGNTSGDFTGHAAVFGNVDSHKDIIRRGAFSASIAAHKAAGTMPALLWSHDQAKPIGRVLSLAEEDQGLAVAGKFNLATTAGRDAHAKAGDINGLSIGYNVPPGGAVHQRNGGRILQRINLHEISPVVFASNSRARIREVKMLATPAEAIGALREIGLSKRAAESFTAHGFAGLKSTHNTPEIDLDRVADVLRQQALELKNWK
jgi:uncharacterized protein